MIAGDEEKVRKKPVKSTKTSERKYEKATCASAPVKGGSGRKTFAKPFEANYKVYR